MTKFPFEAPPLLLATVVDRDDTGKVSVLLSKCEGPSDICINKEMVRLNLAISTGPSSMIKKLEDEPEDTLRQFCLFTDIPRDAKYLENLNNFDVSGWNILREMVGRNKAAKSSLRESLIGVRITHIVSPTEFYVQVNAPEVMAYFALYERELGLAFRDQIRKDDEETPVFKKGEMCVYFIKQEYDYLKTWRRGVVVAQVPDDRYLVFAKDYGTCDPIEVSCMIKMPVTSPFRKDDDFCIKCRLVDIRPAGGYDWTRTALEVFQSMLKRQYDCFLLLVKETSDGSLPPKKPRSFGVDIIAKESRIVNPLAPSRTFFVSMRSELVRKGVAMPEKGANCDQEEEKLNQNTIITKRSTEVSYRFNNSILSALRAEYMPVSIHQAAQEYKYLEAEYPTESYWDGEVTDFDHTKLEIWFRVVTTVCISINLFFLGYFKILPVYFANLGTGN